MTHNQKATISTKSNKYLIKQIKICCKKEDRNNIKNNQEKKDEELPHKLFLTTIQTAEISNAIAKKYGQIYTS